ncbi:MAG: helix-turn-helix domain-containing protein [Chloroflexota bacterium]|nr:helix-turn-helix domain-containing protein [Chloroflexota bacterium]
MARRPPAINLSPEEHKALNTLARAASTPQSVAQRAKIVLLAAEGQRNDDIARILGVSRPTVGQWRKSFAERRMDGLHNAPRKGRPFVHDDRAVGQIMAAISNQSQDIARLSTREISRATGISKSTVHRILKYRYPSSYIGKGSADIPGSILLVEKVVDMRGLYFNPPHKALALSVAEQEHMVSAMSAYLLLPSQEEDMGCEVQDGDYDSSSSLSSASSLPGLLTPKRRYNYRRHTEFLRFLNSVDRQVPDGRDVHLHVEPYSTYRHEKVKQWLDAHPRFKVHLAPNPEAWLYQTQSWLAMLYTTQTHMEAMETAQQLVHRVKAFATNQGQLSRPFIWVKSNKKPSPPQPLLESAPLRS